MPVIHQTALAESGPLEDVSLLRDDGELSLEAKAVSDFLTHADLSAVFEHKDAEPYIQKALDEDGEEYEWMPGWAAAQIVDEDDLTGMFFHYLDELDESLESKAIFGAVGRMLDEKAPFKRGTFRRMAKTAVGHRKVKRMVLAMFHKGAIKRAKGGKWAKDKGYRSGGTTMGRRKVAKFKGTNVSKVRASARRAKQKVKESFEDPNLLPLFGFAEPVGTALFSATVREDAEILAGPEALDEMKKRGKKGKPFPFQKKDDAEDEEGEEGDGEEADETVDESVSNGVRLVQGMASLPQTQGMPKRV